MEIKCMLKSKSIIFKDGQTTLKIYPSKKIKHMLKLSIQQLHNQTISKISIEKKMKCNHGSGTHSKNSLFHSKEKSIYIKSMTNGYRLKKRERRRAVRRRPNPRSRRRLPPPHHYSPDRDSASLATTSYTLYRLCNSQSLG